MLPWDGPGAAVFNPAMAAETDRVDFRAATFGSVSGKSGWDFYQATAGIYGGLFAGIAYLSTESAVDGSNALYETSILTPMVAFALDSLAGSGYSLDIGLAIPRHEFNAFNVVTSSSSALDFGAHIAFPSFGKSGVLHAGLTVRNLAAGKAGLPSDPGMDDGFRALLPNYDFSLFWGSLLDRVDLYGEMNLHEHQDASEGPDREDISILKSMGLEVRPIPMLGLKVERTWIKTWLAGVILRVPVKDILSLGAEMNVSHDKFFSEADEGRGWLWSAALDIGLY
ncbi:MAG: hypothetical protein JWP91_2972 [Fibrobacteres bacterium]|nr:hypothetical protein [Fibrobacterota bacterium]